MGAIETVDLTTRQRDILLELIDLHLPNTTVWAFGSRVKWTANSKSDLDLVVFASEEQNLQVGLLREKFQESDLPFRVDLHIWSKLSNGAQSEVKQCFVPLVGAVEK